MKFSIKDFCSKCDQIRSFCVVYGWKITPCTTLIHCTFYFFLISLIRTFSFSHRLKVLRSQSNKSWRKKLQKQSFSDILQNRCSYKFRNFSRKYLCWSFFLIKLQVWRPAALLRRDSNAGVFLWNLPKFQEHFF